MAFLVESSPAVLARVSAGGATLLELIDAQRTSADIYLAYAQALTEHAHALVALEQAAANWDIAF